MKQLSFYALFFMFVIATPYTFSAERFAACLALAHQTPKPLPQERKTPIASTVQSYSTAPKSSAQLLSLMQALKGAVGKFRETL